MKHEDLTHKIIGCAYKVYNALGFGFLESIYQKVMVIELSRGVLLVETERPLEVYYDDEVIGDFYVDLFVEDKIVVKLKFAGK